jgi:hypothetical protein
MKLLTTERLLAALPRADSRDYVLNVVDHRGRRFIHSFFVSSDHAPPGWFVWGVSGSGATQIIARPKAAQPGTLRVPAYTQGGAGKGPRRKLQTF